jgi:hypothetical protein
MLLCCTVDYPSHQLTCGGDAMQRFSLYPLSCIAHGLDHHTPGDPSPDSCKPFDGLETLCYVHHY